MNSFKLLILHLECKNLLDSIPMWDELDDDASDYRDELIHLMEEGEQYCNDLTNTSKRLKQALRKRKDKQNFLKYNNRNPYPQSDFI